MIDIQQENTTARRKEVGEWLKLASENARAAVLLAEAGGLERQALYMAQQSMETAAKGLARRVGMSYEDIKVERHNLLHLYAKTLDLVVSGTDTASRLDKLLSRLSVQGEAYNTLDKLQHMLALTASPIDEKHRETIAREFFAEMMTASPEVVKTLLTVLEKTYDIVDTAISNSTLIENLVTKPLVLRAPRSGRKVARHMASQILKQVDNRQRMKRDVSLLLQDVVPRMMAEVIRRNR